MHTINLNIKTLTPIGNFLHIESNMIAVYQGYVYFINVKKLDTILSLMQLLSEFNEFCNLTNIKNITCWMKEKHIATKELFEETSYYKLRCDFNEYVPCVHGFFKDSFLILNKSSFNNSICNLLKENFKNILLFDFFKTNNQDFNKYVDKLLQFFESKPKCLFSKENSFDFFTNCIFEMDKLKLSEQLSQIDRLNISCFTDKDFCDHFSLEKIITPSNEFFQECLKKNIEFSFKINYCSDNIFCLNIEKYLQIFEYVNSIRIQNEGYFLTEPANITKKTSKILQQNNWLNTNEISSSNFSFMNQSQIFFLNLNENNKKRLNRLLTLNKAQKIEDENFYFSKNSKNKIKFINYAKIKI